VRGGGLTTLLFLLPLLLVFGAFSWYPITRTVIMSLQHTNLVQAPTWVGFGQLPDRHPRSAAPHRRQEHRRVRRPRPDLRLSDSARRRGADERGPALPRRVRHAGVPAGRDPAVVAVLLWKTFYDGSASGVFNTILGWVHLGPYPWLQSQSTALPSLVLESTWRTQAAPSSSISPR